MLFDHRYRASTLIGDIVHRGVYQFSYDDEDRVTYARHDPFHTTYSIDATGAVREISDYNSETHGRAIRMSHPKCRIERGVPTRYPHLLPHPHLPPDCALAHVLAGTWRAFDQ